MSSCDNALLVDPFEYLLTLDKDGWEVSDLVEALRVTPEEVMLVAEMTVGTAWAGCTVQLLVCESGPPNYICWYIIATVLTNTCSPF